MTSRVNGTLKVVNPKGIRHVVGGNQPATSPLNSLNAFATNSTNGAATWNCEARAGLANALQTGKLDRVRVHALLIVAGCLWVSAVCAHGEEFVYLRKTTNGTHFPRYEVLNYRPSFLSSDVIRVPAKDVRGVDQLGTNTRELPNHYVAPVPFSGRCPQFEVHRLQPGVSYLQSIGGGGSSPLAREMATPKAAGQKMQAPPASAPVNTARPRKATVESSRRPFGWPAYDNPLERHPSRNGPPPVNPLDRPAGR